MSAVWRCRVCEGVNRGGRVCMTCGAEVPRGEPLRAAVRTVTPNSTTPIPPVPPSLNRRELRKTPTPDEIWPADTADTADDPVTFNNAFDVRPLPGGCLISFGPKVRR